MPSGTTGPVAWGRVLPDGALAGDPADVSPVCAAQPANVTAANAAPRSNRTGVRAVAVPA